MKPKALVFYTYLPPWRIDVFNEMAKMYDLTIVFLNAEAEGFTYNRELLLSQLNNVNTVFWNRGFIIKGKVFRSGIPELIRKYEPEVVFTHEYSPTSIILATLIKLKTESFKLIVTTSDNLKIATNVGRLKGAFRKYVLNYCQGIVVYSKDVSEWYKLQFPNLNVQICPNIQNPISLLNHLHQFPQIIESFRGKYKLSKKVILYVGRLEYVKGLDLLIKAFAISNLKLDYHLVIVGEGSQRKSLERQSVDEGISEDVIFPGFFNSSELYAWYYLSSLFVLPSRYEPFGAVVNEALVFGTPVLASKNIGAVDLISNGKNGYVFDPENLESFQENLIMGSKLSMDLIDFSSQKKNLMPVSFNDYMDAFLKVNS